MTLDGPGGGTPEDLTPGTFKAKDDINVSLESVGAFGRSLFAETNAVFSASTFGPMSLIRSDFAKDMGSRSIGNDVSMTEADTLATYLSGPGGAAERMTTLNQDVIFGHIALANAAMCICEKYGDVDNFSADAVNTVFHPPSDAKGGTLAAEWGKQSDKLSNNLRLAHLPHVTKSESYDYVRHGYRDGVDMVVLPDGAETPPGGDPMSSGTTDGNDDKKTEATPDTKDNPYYSIPKEDDYGKYTPEQPAPYSTGDRDTTTLAPGASNPSASTGTTMA
ncbi:MAG: hypothetical protein ACRDT4_18915 [Micromonosporaceae bacterium]